MAKSSKKTPNAQSHALDTSFRSLPKGAVRKGPADPGEVLTVLLLIRRKPGSPPLKDQDYWANRPHEQREYMSRTAFGEMYSASQADVDLVLKFISNHKLQAAEISLNRRTIAATGTVKHMNKAFQVDLGYYESPKENFRGREDYIHIPANLEGIIEGVFGLDNRRMARRNLGNPPGAAILTPVQVAKLYNFPNFVNAEGQTIALLEFKDPNGPTIGYSPEDVAAYFDPVTGIVPGLPPVLVDVPVGTSSNQPVGNEADLEVILDIDVSAAIAQGAKIAVYFTEWTEMGWIAAVSAVIHDHVNAPSILSISWGWSENETVDMLAWTPAAVNGVSDYFQEAAMMGITILVSSGDDGSNCFIGDGLSHVCYPASDPWAISCGGTILTYVSGNNFTENAWNDRVADLEGLEYEGGATGGGVSIFFPLPSWQSNAKVPLSLDLVVTLEGGRIRGSHYKGRGIPDIAGNASSYSGYQLYLEGNTHKVGGTSAVAPLYAGLIALLNNCLRYNLGYLNPTLYAIASRKNKVFRDINDGRTNSVPYFLPDSVPISSAISPGYTCTEGWDACTGLGVLNGVELLMALLPKIPTVYIINPLVFIYGELFKIITLPDPPPRDKIIREIRELSAGLSAGEKRTLLTGLKSFLTYANEVEKELG